MTDDTKFTSGPWRMRFHGSMPNGVGMFWLNDKTSIATSNKRDANLACAAPEIYEALLDALDYIDALPYSVVSALPAMPGFDRDAIDAITAKARGEA